MSRDALPRFKPGELVVTPINGQVFEVVNNYEIGGRNFLNVRVIESYNVCLQPIDATGDRSRQILHELQLEPYETEPESINIMYRNLPNPEPGPTSATQPSSSCTWSKEQSDTQKLVGKMLTTQSGSQDSDDSLSSAIRRMKEVDEDDYFVPDSHVLLNENHEVYDDINTSGDQEPNEIDLEKDDAKAPKEIDFNNPFGDVVTDEDGNELEVGTIEYFKKLGDRSKFDQRTRGAQLAEFRSLEQWVLKAKGADVWDSFAQSALHPVEADCLLSGYIQTRFNKTEFKKTGRVVRLDPNTIGPMLSKLNRVIEEKTTYRPNKDERFELFRNVMRDHSKQSAKKPGMGQLMNTSDPITPPEIAWILQSASSSLWIPKPLVQRLYTIIVVVFNLRCDECRKLTFGNFKLVWIQGVVAYIMYIPAAAKMRNGRRLSSKTYKRPVAAMSIDPEFNLANLLDHHMRRMDPSVLKEYADNLDSLPLWFEVKNVTTGPDDSFYLTKPMGDKCFNRIVFNAFTQSGLAVNGRKISNSSLRTSTFNLQEGLCIDAVSRQAFSGHVAPMTSTHYLRRNCEKNHKVGAQVTEKITGSQVVQVDWEAVYLQDGRKEYPRKMSGTPLATEVEVPEDDPNTDPDTSPPGPSTSAVAKKSKPDQASAVARSSRDSNAPGSSAALARKSQLNQETVVAKKSKKVPAPDLTKRSKPQQAPDLTKSSKPQQAPDLTKSSMPQQAPAPVRSNSISKYKASPTGRSKLFSSY